MTNEMPESSPSPGEVVTGIEVRLVQEEDLPQIDMILEAWVRDPGTGVIIQREVDEVLERIRQGIDNPENGTNVVAEDLQGRVIGVMGIYPVDPEMQQYVTTDNPREINNAYVADDVRGSGAGKSLVKKLESIGLQRGYKELVLNSGPRYKETGWEFWKRVYGEPVDVAKDYYGPGYDAMVWRKLLG